MRQSPPVRQIVLILLLVNHPTLPFLVTIGLKLYGGIIFICRLSRSYEILIQIHDMTLESAATPRSRSTSITKSQKL